VHTLNLGILAHIDAGKTSLTERLLHAVGVIDEIGRVDDGSTQTDSLALERRRGITIKSAVVSFAVDGVAVNLIDTPGHPDFIAEVERVLSVLDGAVLVVSAVEGVQGQTRVLMRALRRLRIPTLVFVNKIDRRGAQDEHLLRSLADKLALPVVSMGSVEGLGTHEAAFAPYGASRSGSAAASDAAFRSSLIDLLADHDEALAASYVADETALSYERLRRELASQTGRALAHPVFFGSAITGAGVAALISGIRELLPATERDAGGPVSGTVFKVERGPAGEKIAYVRLLSGTVRTRDRLRYGSGEGGDGGGPVHEGKVTGIGVFDGGTAVRRTSVAAGQIGTLWGLSDIRIGDEVGDASDGAGRSAPVGEDQQRPHEAHFAPPTLETAVLPRRAADRGALHVALTQLAEQDPLINLRQDTVRQEVHVSLYGEVQKEVIEATLADDFGVEVTFRETATICIERPNSTGAAFELMHKEPNPFLATVGLRVDPAPLGSGVSFGLEVELGSMPYAFIKAVEETVHRTLEQGLNGWQVTDCAVTMTHAGYSARQSHSHGVFDKSMSSTAGDFRTLTPLVLMSALSRAGTTVYEPVHRFELDVPADTVGALLPLLARLGAVPGAPVVRGSACVVDGEIPAASVHELERRLAGLTRGEGALEYAFAGYRRVSGAIPARERWDHNPLDRKAYLLRLVRRVVGQEQA
jgi:ribosomal protection tetracycline resistance protein